MGSHCSLPHIDVQKGKAFQASCPSLTAGRRYSAYLHYQMRSGQVHFYPKVFRKMGNDKHRHDAECELHLAKTIGLVISNQSFPRRRGSNLTKNGCPTEELGHDDKGGNMK